MCLILCFACWFSLKAINGTSQIARPLLHLKGRKCHRLWDCGQNRQISTIGSQSPLSMGDFFHSQHHGLCVLAGPSFILCQHQPFWQLGRGMKTVWDASCPQTRIPCLQIGKIVWGSILGWFVVLPCQWNHCLGYLCLSDCVWKITRSVIIALFV